MTEVEVISGRGCLGTIADLVPAERVLLVTSAGATRRGLTSRIRDLLGPRDFEILEDIASNPELDVIDAASARLRSHRTEYIVAVGGGSVLDTAKVLSATLQTTSDRPLHDTFRVGQVFGWPDPLPTITVPTTAGTGAEVTPFSTIWDTPSGCKRSSDGIAMLYPKVAVLDPELTLTLGPLDTLYPGLDTISHALEALWNRHRTPVSDAFSLRALHLANSALPRVLADPEDLDARESMQIASMLAGLAITRTRTAIAHSMSYAPTLKYGIPHGLACSYTLPRIIDLAIRNGVLQGEPRELAREVQVTLIGLKLDQRVEVFARRAEIAELVPAMRTPGRSDNFPLQLTDADLRALVQG